MNIYYLHKPKAAFCCPIFDISSYNSEWKQESGQTLD